MFNYDLIIFNLHAFEKFCSNKEKLEIPLKLISEFRDSFAFH